MARDRPGRESWRMTGSTPTGDGRCLHKHLCLHRCNREGVWGREGLAISPERRLADDGKRPYRRWTLYLDDYRIGKGSGGNHGSRLGLIETWRMTGSAPTGDGRWVHEGVNRVGGLGEGMAKYSA